VLDTVTPFIDSDSRGARWVARDVARELRRAGDRLASAAGESVRLHPIREDATE
jgi:hypothetical protein